MDCEAPHIVSVIEEHGHQSTREVKLELEEGGKGLEKLLYVVNQKEVTE